ncbi:SDR family NAD(P)-dependent oxidoreductase [soil metagenome]
MKNTVLGGVVITGASTGIGEACAFHLDALGFHVFAGVRDPADGERLTRVASDRLVPVHLDVTDAVSVKAAAETVALDALRRQMEVNVIGQVAVTQAFLPPLRRARGRIVNMGSMAGRFASPFMGPYSTSKFALEAITDSLRLELRPWGIHVSIVEPGVIATPIWQKSLLAAGELTAAMPEEAHTLYGRAIESIRHGVENIGGIPAEMVARVVAHALTARRPRPRYVVGRDARMAVGLTYLPTRVRDWLVAQRVGAL